MFSVVVSWTKNKDPTSDKGIWLFGTEWEAQCSARGCPSVTEPFSTLGTDMKAASTLLKCSHICRHKGRHTRTQTYMHTHTHSQCRKYACHGRPGKGGSKNNFLSTRIRKTTFESRSAWECETKALAPLWTRRSAEGKHVHEMQPYEHCHCPPQGTKKWLNLRGKHLPHWQTLTGWWGLVMSGLHTKAVTAVEKQTWFTKMSRCCEIEVFKSC